MQQIIKNNPWVPFLLLGLVSQQANMLTYKFGGEVALPYVFLIYSFLVQSIINLGLIFVFKKHFPIVLNGKMRLWVLWVALIYLINETLFISIYQMGAPYSLMMTVFALMGVINMTFVGIVFIKEHISRRQVMGIVLAAIAIVLVKLG